MAAVPPPPGRRVRRVSRRVHALIINPDDITGISLASQKLQALLNLHFSRLGLNNNTNVVFSPLGAHMCLSLLRTGSTGETAIEMQRCAKYVNLNKAGMEEGYKKIMRVAEEDLLIMFAPRCSQKPIMHFINRLYIPPQYKDVDAGFIQHAMDYYGTEVLTEDLNDIATVDRINAEIQERTDGRIVSALITGEFVRNNPGQVLGMVMINVLYFRSLWEGHNAFDPTLTTTMAFTKTNGEIINVPMMTNKRMYASYSNFVMNDCGIAALYFEGGRYCLLIYLPRSPNATSIKTLELRMDRLTMNTVAEAFVRYHRRARRGDGGLLLNIKLPRFTVSLDTSMRTAFMGSGAVLAFNPRTSEFTGIHPNGDNRQLNFTDCAQKVMIEINETSAPVNMNIPVYPFPRSAGDCRVKTKKFHCTRPFMFSIFDYVNNVTIAHGTVYNPLMGAGSRVG